MRSSSRNRFLDIDPKNAFFESTGKGEVTELKKSGSTVIGFKVENVDETYNQLIRAGALSLWQTKDMPWGRTARVCDFDGRPIEIF